MKRKILIFAATAILFCTAATAAVCLFPAGPGEKKGYGMFSWHTEAMGEEEEDRLYRCARQAGVTEIYQQFDFEGTKAEKTEDFVKKLKKRNITAYALMGDAAWARERHGDSLIEEIHMVVEYNKKQGREGRISGVMVDVEPYLLEEWDEGSEARQALMEDYLRGMEYAYAYAKKNKLKFIVCVPTFFDVTNQEVLEDLVAYACDGIAVMNYNRSDEYGQIAKEVGFAREYGREIICIYELQEAGEHELEEINTYAGEGLGELWKWAEKLEKQFGYEKLSFAYHYYEPLAELLEEGE